MEHQSTAGPAPAVKLVPLFAVGQVWERRDGKRVTVERLLYKGSTGACTVKIPGASAYTVFKDGSYWGPHAGLASADLIRLISDPEAADPWARERRALAAGLRVQARRLRCASDSWGPPNGASTGWNMTAPDWEFRVHPDDELQMQAIERGERPEDFPSQNAVRELKTAAAAVWDEHKDKTHSYAMWLANRPARLAARKPLAVSAARFDPFAARGREPLQMPDMSGVLADYWNSQKWDALARPPEIGAFPVHNPDARMATVPTHWENTK